MERVCSEEKVALLDRQKRYDRLNSKEMSAQNVGDDLYAEYIHSRNPAKRPEYTSAELAKCDMFHSMCNLIVKLQGERDSYNAIEKADALREGVMLASGFDFSTPPPDIDPFAAPDVDVTRAAAARIAAMYQLGGLPVPAALTQPAN